MNMVGESVDTKRVALGINIMWDRRGISVSYRLELVVSRDEQQCACLN